MVVSRNLLYQGVSKPPRFACFGGHPACLVPKYFRPWSPNEDTILGSTREGTGEEADVEGEKPEKGKRQGNQAGRHAHKGQEEERIEHENP